MHTLTAQRGMTFWGVLIILALIVFFTLLTLKLAPPYMEHGKVVTALRAIEKQSPSGSFSKDEVRRALDRRFTIDDVRRVNLSKDLYFEKKPGGIVVVRIAYEVRVPMAYNITALIEFDESVELRGN
ncbi:MAG: hypothetical protein A2150_01205 [Candidatus Muproteobacteria bacterium RBG_16_64_11]|uniref:DUF4845 domain-containing protein n=1 Tax=Candidatus Muproteobacteria bacterium RBG_16_64_11 TaxID=1817758 RepID=A0A1F6TFQ9_9PROT|nr:MAG: hypothetical protein A2150_01205 [Candidatus Muproteobacteria bacterium RBG_16_64_11]